jgi:hypothetical protein
MGDMLPVRLWPFSPSDPALIIDVACGLALVLKLVSAVGEPGTELDLLASDW